MAIPLLEPPPRIWECPNCDHEDVSYETRPHTRMHTCPGMKLMTMPMVERGVSAKVELVEREDYVGSDTVQMDEEGTPWMSAVTTRDDGQDCTLYASHATL